MLQVQRLENEAILDELEDSKDSTLSLAHRHGVEIEEIPSPKKQTIIDYQEHIPLEKIELSQANETVPIVFAEERSELADLNNTHIVQVDHSLAEVSFEPNSEDEFEPEPDFKISLMKCDTAKHSKDAATPKLYKTPEK